MSLNHPETIPSFWSGGKLSSLKLVPGAKMFRDWYIKGHGSHYNGCSDGGPH